MSKRNKGKIAKGSGKKVKGNGNGKKAKEIGKKMKSKIKFQSSKDDIPKPVARTHSLLRKKGLSVIEKCKIQMAASLLRMTDENLYTIEAKEANMDEQKFITYHEAYELAASSWPVKPTQYILEYLKKKSFGNLTKLTFADIGCGRCPLVKQGLPEGTVVYSYDLISTHPDITQANMEKLPLENESVNVCIYSLSLMAKNLGKILLEAKRILKSNGSLLIVEVTSRFEGKEKRWTNQLMSIGFKQKKTDTLPPNGYFTFFHFVKQDSNLDFKNRDLRIQLKPCQYKAR